MNFYIIYPNFELEPIKIEPEFSEEEKMSKMSGFKSILVDHNAICALDPNFIITRCSHGIAIYRGWMLSPVQYEFFYQTLSNKGIFLITNPIAYKALHYYPIAYKYFSDYGIESFWTNKPENDIREMYQFIRQSNKVVMKDYVKCEKGTKFQYIDGNISREKFRKLLKEFIEFRGNHYNGGIVLKKYIDPKMYETENRGVVSNNANEWRAFFFKGEMISLEQNSNLSMYTITSWKDGKKTERFGAKKPDEIFVKQTARNLKCLSPFFTIDFIEDVNGKFHVMESGDGQVSGIAPKQSGYMFFKSIYDRIIKEQKKKEIQEIFST